MALTEIVVAVTLGQGQEFCITHNDQLIIRKVHDVNTETALFLGRATEARFNEMIEYLNRLKVHAVPQEH
jgi:hypothetical protein